MKYRRNLIIILIAICIYFVINIIYNQIILKNNYMKIYSLKKDVNKGEKISIDMIEEINVLNISENDYINDINIILDKYATRDLKKGQIITKKLINEKDKIVIADDSKEIVSLKISVPENVNAYNLEKGNIVNVYYTGKAEESKNILNNKEIEYITSGGSPEYVTGKLIENIKVIGVCDNYGNNIVHDENEKNEVNVITVLFEVDKDMVIILNNLEKYGEFTLSLIK